MSADDWTKCAYCLAAAGSADPCCADCRHDPHAHCPSWPSCTRCAVILSGYTQTAREGR